VLAFPFGVNAGLSSMSPELLMACIHMRMNGAGIDFKRHDIWLLGCLAAWLLGCLAAWLLGCLRVHMLTGLELFNTSAIGAQAILHGGQIYANIHDMSQALIKRHTDWACCQSSLSCSSAF
jgi:hypothetical protein